MAREDGSDAWGAQCCFPGAPVLCASLRGSGQGQGCGAPGVCSSVLAPGGGLGAWGFGGPVPQWPWSEGGAGAGSAATAPAPGSHRGGCWLGARVWFEISATGPGLPRDLAARSWDKHWKVGRASRAHKEPLVASGGDEGVICPEVWVRRGRWEAAGRLVGRVSTGRGGLGSQTAWLGCHGPGFESWFCPFVHWASPVRTSVSLPVKWGSNRGHTGVRMRWGEGRRLLVRSVARLPGFTSRLCDLEQVTSQL